MRLIDADALKDKLQQHHDFYVMTWGGFGKMPIGEKKRVDEITNCIAEVVNAPTIEPKRGEWIYGEHDVAMCDGYRCDRCGFFVPWDYEHKSIDFINDYHYCPNCGARMKGADDES